MPITQLRDTRMSAPPSIIPPIDVLRPASVYSRPPVTAVTSAPNIGPTLTPRYGTTARLLVRRATGVHRAMSGTLMASRLVDTELPPSDVESSVASIG